MTAKKSTKSYMLIKKKTAKLTFYYTGFFIDNTPAYTIEKEKAIIFQDYPIAKVALKNINDRGYEIVAVPSYPIEIEKQDKVYATLWREIVLASAATFLNPHEIANNVLIEYKKKFRN